jgi:dihydropyrimidine dehydrogenase (NAD+) subunit PreT
MDLGTTSIVATSVGVAVAFAAGMVGRRALRARADARAIAELAARQRDLPRSLHPVIDPDICIGSLSCLKSCPEGDILGIIEGAARLVQADHCVGHGRCAAECPVGAIQLVFGTDRRGVDLPEVDGAFESSRPGVHIVGELGGMGLIKNAIRQGLECAEYLAEALARRRREGGEAMVDVAVVGAGPAGLATALGLKRADVGFRILEQSTMGGAVAHYPRHKVVMSETVELPFFGKFGKRRISKEELLHSFERMVAKGGLSVEEGVKITGIEGADGAFEVVTEKHGRVRARKVVLAIGRRGTPRKLGVPGEELEKVVYGLVDPEQYRGARVLVVGGGDAALEAALQLAAEPGTEVTLSYRGEALGRCREANRREAEAAAAAGRLRLLLSSEVRRIGAGEVVVAVSGAERPLANDHVVVNVGGELPLELLARCGVQMRRYFGEAPGARRPAEGATREQMLAGTLEKHRARRNFDHRLALAFVAAGALILAFLAWKGRQYYPLPEAERRLSPLHRSMRSAGPWGHGVGIAATLFMLSNFLYAARKRFAFMARWGRIRAWLHFHVFVGFMSPLVIAFHAAFQSKNLLATGTAASLSVVVLTGIVGRYIYGLVPSSGGKALEMEELQAAFVRLRDEIEPLVTRSRDPERIRRLFDRANAPVARGSLPLLLLERPFLALVTRVHLLRVRRLFPARETYQVVRDAYLRLRRLRVQIGFYRSLKRLLGGWRVFHASLAIFLVLAIAAHIAVSLYLGYGLGLFR